jgi:hypothetical protein
MAVKPQRSGLASVEIQPLCRDVTPGRIELCVPGVAEQVAPLEDLSEAVRIAPGQPELSDRDLDFWQAELGAAPARHDELSLENIRGMGRAYLVAPIL